MKAICAPSSGKISDRVAYISTFGQCFRGLVCPANHRTEAQQIMRQIFGNLSRAWGIKLTQQQRDVWNQEAPNQWTHPKLGQRGKLWGALFWESINAVRGRVGLPPAWTPPPRYIFPLTVVRELIITNDQNGVRLFVRLAAPPTEDIMVFGQEPCSAGRSKRRNVSYLGLLSPRENGLSEITALFKAKFGEPRPGKKIFIVTCQTKDGWKGMDHETNEIVPPLSEVEQAAPVPSPTGVTDFTQIGAPGAIRPANSTPSALSAPAQTGDSHKPLMHQGCTSVAEGLSKTGDSHAPGGTEAVAGGGIGPETASGGGGGGKKGVT